MYIRYLKFFLHVLRIFSVSDFPKQICIRHILSFLVFFLHPIISEHAAIDFQPTAQANSLHQNVLSPCSEIMGCRKKLKSLICANTYLLRKIPSCKISENMTKSLRHLTESTTWMQMVSRRTLTWYLRLF